MAAASSPWIKKFDQTGSTQGALRSFRFAVKGMIPVQGQVPSLGNQSWDAEQLVAQSSAFVVEHLLSSGAQLVGTTVLDELALGVTGVNPQTGTPLNPSAPDRVPGGSSSGSAAVVAAGDVDFALGSDTGGSVRVPASWCGVVGWRPSLGLIPVDSMPVQSPSMDVVGVLAKNVSLMEEVGRVFGCQPELGMRSIESMKLVFVEDLWQLSSPPGPDKEVVQRAWNGQVEETTLADIFAPMEITTNLLTEVFLHIGMFEVASSRGQWVTTHAEHVSASLRDTIDAFQKVTEPQYEAALGKRAAIRQALETWMDNRVLIFPTTPGPAPLLNDSSGGSPSHADNLGIQMLCALSSVTGFPQVTIPVRQGDCDAPRGLSLLGNFGNDMKLMQIAKVVTEAYETK